MTDDLVKRLREKGTDEWLHTLLDEAADRIEYLEEKLRKENNYAYVIDSQGIVHHAFTLVYRDTLAGEKKDG